MDDTSDLFGLTFMTTSKALSSTIYNTSFLEGWRTSIENLGQARRQYHDALAKVLQSDEFTEAGKAKRKVALQAALAERLKDEAAEIDSYDRHINELDLRAKNKLGPQELKPGWETVQANRLLNKIEAMDPATVRGEYESKLRDHDGDHDLWLTAAEYAQTPMGQPMLSGETLDLGARSRARRTMDPKDRQQLQDLETLRDAHQHFIHLTQRDLPEPDEIREMAGLREPPDDAA